jgi:ERF superfamily
VAARQEVSAPAETEKPAGDDKLVISETDGEYAKAHRKKGIAAKLAWIVAQVERIPKNGWNSSQNYAFVQEGDIVDFVRPYLAIQNLTITFDTIDCELVDRRAKPEAEVKGQRATLMVQMNAWDGDDPKAGPVPIGRFPGTANDSGDKAITKALTSAKKYAYLLTFHLSTGNDLEDEPKADGKPAGQQGGGNRNAPRGGQQQQQQRRQPALAAEPNGPIAESQKNTINTLNGRCRTDLAWDDGKIAAACKAVSANREDKSGPVDAVEKLRFNEAGEYIRRIQDLLRKAKQAAEGATT